MRWLSLPALAIPLLAALPLAAQMNMDHPAPPAKAKSVAKSTGTKPAETKTSSAAVTLDPGLGPMHHRVTTADPESQKYFDQGLNLVFGFNHDEALKSFQRAAALDPNMPMAYWGIAYAVGPN